MQVYPGLCNNPGKGRPCPAPTSLCIAVPEDPSDPLQTNWTKDGKVGTLTGYVNPIVNDTGRDPSTAWQTPHGEWRLTTYGSVIYGSMDFKTWYEIGTQAQFPGGECPSFFPLPNTTADAGPAPVGAATPTHVYKTSSSGRDWMMVGSYTPAAPKLLGTFSATTGVPHGLGLIDLGALYASKDFYDPVKQRRINFGWAKIAFGPWAGTNTWDASAHTLPREVTWHPELQQLVYSPLAEQDALRGTVIGRLKTQPMYQKPPHRYFSVTSREPPDRVPPHYPRRTKCLRYHHQWPSLGLVAKQLHLS